ncbi:molybdopterin binding oxidoreductase [Hypoxylon fragiforme]|uniref:molybdopterin binding oxidoreductase n=1 Tax=Hypoxylon fragiforme TaxID=63214 RepID=UPI0020C6C03F|nr:molybdopterin binding oxidoreductase [Hypoxylon fragiforme]KAI2611356.1 molybdopterin binding oxidoreductase [Hypoxylon fragiforme]
MADRGVRGEEPLNREPKISKLASVSITEDGYERNHCVQPAAEQLNARTHSVQVDGAVKEPLNLSITSLRTDFPQHEVICALQCPENRRHGMRTLVKEVQGIDWVNGAVMNCRWRGPLLKDVLGKAGIADSVEQEGTHVAFTSFQVKCQEDSWYGASIPLSRALDPDKEVVLALERNGKPLTIRHGYPVRVITPGVEGAKSVKWLDKITVQKEESPNYYMQRDYKTPLPQAVDSETAEKYWGVTPPMQEMPVNSVVVSPRKGDTVKRNEEGKVVCHGYALPSGDGGSVVKVEISADGGLTWSEAALEQHEGEGKWAWKFWRASVNMAPGNSGTILSKASDASGQTQSAVSPWNLKDVCYNGFGEARDLTVE